MDIQIRCTIILMIYNKIMLNMYPIYLYYKYIYVVWPRRGSHKYSFNSFISQSQIKDLHKCYRSYTIIQFKHIVTLAKLVQV